MASAIPPLHSIHTKSSNKQQHISLKTFKKLTVFIYFYMQSKRDQQYINIHYFNCLLFYLPLFDLHWAKSSRHIIKISETFQIHCLRILTHFLITKSIKQTETTKKWIHFYQNISPKHFFFFFFEKYHQSVVKVCN